MESLRYLVTFCVKSDHPPPPFFFSLFLATDTGNTYLKPCKTLIGFALPVVESATAVCAGKLKDGLPPVLFTKRLFSQPCLRSLSLSVELTKLNFVHPPDIKIGLQIRCALPHSDSTLTDKFG